MRKKRKVKKKVDDRLLKKAQDLSFLEFMLSDPRIELIVLFAKLFTLMQILKKKGIIDDDDIAMIMKVSLQINKNITTFLKDVHKALAFGTEDVLRELLEDMK